VSPAVAPARGRGDPRDVGTVRALYAVGKCQADRCGAAIRWVATTRKDGRGRKLLSGKPIPLDHGRDPLGPLVLEQDPSSGDWTTRPIVDADDPNRPRYSLHWLTCIDSAMYREVRTEADPLGILPSAERKVTARPHVTIGGEACHRCANAAPGGLGHLCADCSRVVVAAWSPAMGPTVRSWPPALRTSLGVDDWPDDRRRAFGLEPCTPGA
jgi:hypothetical protein